MTHEIANDILAKAPVHPSAVTQLVENHGFTDRHLQERIEGHQAHITRHLGTLGTVLEMSQPASLEPVPLVHGDSPTYPAGSFQESYDSLRHDPVKKLKYDSEAVDELLRKLGPTNPMNNSEKFDAGIDLGSLIHLLQTDFEALPSVEKLPEKRMTEGILREELALLWRPKTPKNFARREHQAFMFDLSDPNMFTEEQLATVSEPDRWKLIGARMSDEAADVFEAIVNSPSAALSERLVARCRMTDMRIRSLRIQAGMNIGDTQKQKLYDQIAQLNTDYMGELATISDHPAGNRGLGSGLFFELFVVGQERNNLIKNGEVNKLIRLALSREDRVHRQIVPYKNAQGVHLNMSADVVVEDTAGNFVQAYQTKAMSETSHINKKQHHGGNRSREIYSPERIAMRYIEHYRGVNTNGVDLKKIPA